jgi:predicted RNA-binding protein with RPS1 domain
MQQNRPVRVIKREQRGRTEESVKAATEEGAENTERKLKTVVSGWVREHQQRSEEYRQMFAALLKETGLRPSGTPSRA